MLFYGQESCKLLGHMKTGLLVPVSECVAMFIKKFHIRFSEGRLIGAFL